MSPHCFNLSLSLPHTKDHSERRSFFPRSSEGRPHNNIVQWASISCDINLVMSTAKRSSYISPYSFCASPLSYSHSSSLYRLRILKKKFSSGKKKSKMLVKMLVIAAINCVSYIYEKCGIVAAAVSAKSCPRKMWNLCRTRSRLWKCNQMKGRKMHILPW